MSDVRTVKLKFSDLIFLEDNPRTITRDKLERLAQRIRKDPTFFENRPCLVNYTGGQYVCYGGFQRSHAAAKILKWKEVPCSVENDIPTEVMRERAILDNTHDGDWSADVLANWEFDIPELRDMGVPEFVFGEGSNALNSEKLEAQEDDYEIPEEIKTDIVPGDLFEIGTHRLLCGDSTNADDVAKLMDGEKAEILFTSPPYVEMRKYNGGKDLSLDKLIKFIPAWSAVCEYLCINLGLQFKDSEVVAYWDDYLIEAKEAGLKLVAWNVWDKTMGGTIASATNMFLLTHEWIFVFGTQRKRLNRTIPNQADKYEARHGKDWQKGIDKHFRNEEDAMEATTSATYSHHQLHSVVQQTPELGNIRSLHPATFPVGLPAKYIEAMTDEKQIVAESFTGSGTTMVAAHQLNRRCFGIEIDAKYCQVIIDRMLKLDPTLEIKRNGQPYQKTG